MDAIALKQLYAHNLRMQVELRRYIGTGATRTRVTAVAKADVRTYAPAALIGNIQQGDVRAVVYADDLTDNGLDLPVTTDDRIFFQGREYQVVAPAPRVSQDGTLVAYELHLRG